VNEKVFPPLLVVCGLVCLSEIEMCCIPWLFYLRRKQTSIEQKKEGLGFAEVGDAAIS